MEKELWQVLIDNNLEPFVMIFEENNLDRELLSELTESDYVKLGITGEAIKKMLKLFSLNYKDKVQNPEISDFSGNQEAIVETATTAKEISPVHKILLENNLSEYISIFDKHKLNSLDIISKLTENDLSELGIIAIGDRKKIKSIFDIAERKIDESNKVVVTQTVKSEETNTGGIIVSILIGAILISFVLYYAIPRFIL
ncbi:SAM domain-containing protein [Treponema primitia]|uniref:SAM domain-containing protein n=1 Tax=Treponema primitia TaxID=88058 RepID=UPI00397FA61D